MDSGAGRWVNRIVGWCFSILAATIALYGAVKVLEAIWPALVAIVGICVLAAAVVRAIVYFTTNKTW